MACQAALHPFLGIVARHPDVRKTVGLAVELKVNPPSPCEETNRAARLAIGQAGVCWCKGQARVRGLCEGGNEGDLFCLVSPRAAHHAKPPAHGGPDRKCTASLGIFVAL